MDIQPRITKKTNLLKVQIVLDLLGIISFVLGGLYSQDTAYYFGALWAVVSFKSHMDLTEANEVIKAGHEYIQILEAAVEKYRDELLKATKS